MATSKARDNIEKLRYVLPVPQTYGAVADGATDDTAAIVEADEAAALAGRPLAFPEGVYLISASTTFTARVVMRPGARIKTSSSTVYLDFAQGFDAQSTYVLDVDGPTRFRKIDRILPQWFGATGLKTQDATTALTRTFKACRNGMRDVLSSDSDADQGCLKVYFSRGVYRCNNVDVFANTIIDGEVAGAINVSCIQQISNAAPALRVHAKNYGFSGAVVNPSNGISHFHRVNIRSDAVNDSSENAPAVKFLSPNQSAAIFGDATVGAGVGGHISVSLERVWGQFTAGACFGVDDGKLVIDVKDCTFDLTRHAIRYTDTAVGYIRSCNNLYYGCLRGAFENTSSDAVDGVSLYSADDQFFGCGIGASSTERYRRAINWAPSSFAATHPAEVLIRGAQFKRVDIDGIRLGGPVLVQLVDRFEMTGFSMRDPNSADNFKAIYIGAGVKSVELDGAIESSAIATYAGSRLLEVNQSTQSLSACRIDIAFTNYSATDDIAAAIASDYALTNVDTSECTFDGSFTLAKSLNITDRLSGKAAYDPPSLVDGAGVTTTLTVTGVDTSGLYGVHAWFSLPLQDITLTAWVSAANTVSVRFQNESGGTVDLGSGTLYAKAFLY